MTIAPSLPHFSQVPLWLDLSRNQKGWDVDSSSKHRGKATKLTTAAVPQSCPSLPPGAYAWPRPWQLWQPL